MTSDRSRCLNCATECHFSPWLTLCLGYRSLLPKACWDSENITAPTSSGKCNLLGPDAASLAAQQSGLARRDGEDLSMESGAARWWVVPPATQDLWDQTEQPSHPSSHYLSRISLLLDGPWMTEFWEKQQHSGTYMKDSGSNLNPTSWRGRTAAFR